MTQLDEELLEIQQKLAIQQLELQNLGRTLHGTMLIVDLYSALLLYSKPHRIHFILPQWNGNFHMFSHMFRWKSK